MISNYGMDEVKKIQERYDINAHDWVRLIARFTIAVKLYNKGYPSPKYNVRGGNTSKENLLEALILKEMLYVYTSGRVIAKIEKDKYENSYSLIIEQK